MPRSLRIAALLALVLTAWAQSARAHFIWIDAGGSADARQALVVFNEGPEAGEARLLAKISQTQAWVRQADGTVVELKLGNSTDEKLAALVAQLPADKPGSVEATCDYGVYQRGPKGILLQYYAKHLGPGWAQQSPAALRAEKLQLDIVPMSADNRLTLQLLYHGKPDAGSEFVVIGPDEKQQDLKTDAEGRVVLNSPAAGRYALRAAHIDIDAAGERDGKSYAATGHYATLTLAVPDASSAASSSAADSPTAAELLVRARDGRSIWEDFPGFTTDLTISAPGQQVSGKATIDTEGSVKLDMPDSPLRKWAEQQLESLVQHRMPDGEVNTGKVTFVENEAVHPLGQQIDLGDPDLGSRYRLKDDVIMEVQRKMGPMRFVISVLEISRNPEGKYLPQSFTMNFFDGATGALKSSLGFRNDWQRVGKFDLPLLIVENDARNGTVTTRQIAFSNSVLAEKK